MKIDAPGKRTFESSNATTARPMTIYARWSLKRIPIRVGPKRWTGAR